MEQVKQPDSPHIQPADGGGQEGGSLRLEERRLQCAISINDDTSELG